MAPAPEGRQTMAHIFANLLTHVIFSSTPQGFISREIHRLPEGAPDRLRRAVDLGRLSAAPAGAAECGGCSWLPRLTPWAILCRPSGPQRAQDPILVKGVPMLGFHAKPVTARNVETPGPLPLGEG
jgi:hypothetical protein